MDQESSLPSVAHIGHEPDVVFVSPESGKKKENCPSVKVNIAHNSGPELDNRPAPAGAHDELVSLDHADEAMDVDPDDAQIRATSIDSDCCKCNLALRKDIDELRRRLIQNDRRMSSRMNDILSLLDANSNNRSPSRKLGSSIGYVSKEEESAI